MRQGNVGTPSRLLLVSVGVAASIAAGCGAASGRIADVPRKAHQWQIWVPPSRQVLYLRIKWPVVAGERGPCPGFPWGLVQPYPITKDGAVKYRRGEMRFPFDRQLQKAFRRAHKASKPPWIKAFDRLCARLRPTTSR